MNELKKSSDEILWSVLEKQDYYVNITPASNQTINIIEKLQNNEIEINPLYKGQSKKWDTNQNSKYIESLMLGLPQPNFIILGDKEGFWQIIDGFKRITAIKDFIVDQKHRLNSLDFLKEYNINSFYFDLHRTHKRMINSSIAMTYFISEKTPEAVKKSIIKRIRG